MDACSNFITRLVKFKLFAARLYLSSIKYVNENFEVNFTREFARKNAYDFRDQHIEIDGSCQVGLNVVPGFFKNAECGSGIWKSVEVGSCTEKSRIANNAGLRKRDCGSGIPRDSAPASSTI